MYLYLNSILLFVPFSSSFSFFHPPCSLSCSPPIHHHHNHHNNSIFCLCCWYCHLWCDFCTSSIYSPYSFFVDYVAIVGQDVFLLAFIVWFIYSLLYAISKIKMYALLLFCMPVVVVVIVAIVITLTQTVTIFLVSFIVRFSPSEYFDSYMNVLSVSLSMSKWCGGRYSVSSLSS